MPVGQRSEMGSCATKSTPPVSVVETAVSAQPRFKPAPIAHTEWCWLHEIGYAEGFQCESCAITHAGTVVAALPALHASASFDFVEVDTYISKKLDEVHVAMLKAQRHGAKAIVAATDRITCDMEALESVLALSEGALQSIDPFGILLALEAASLACNAPGAPIELNCVVLPATVTVERVAAVVQRESQVCLLDIDPCKVSMDGLGWENFSKGAVSAKNEFQITLPHAPVMATPSGLWRPRPSSIQVSITSQDMPGISVSTAQCTAVSATQVVVSYAVEVPRLSSICIAVSVYGHSHPSWTRTITPGFTTASEAYTVPLRQHGALPLGFAVNKAGTRALVITSKSNVEVYDCTTGDQLVSSSPIAVVIPPFCTAVTPDDTVFIAGAVRSTICEITFDGAFVRTIRGYISHVNLTCLTVSSRRIVACMTRMGEAVDGGSVPLILLKSYPSYGINDDPVVPLRLPRADGFPPFSGVTDVQFAPLIYNPDGDVVVFMLQFGQQSAALVVQTVADDMLPMRMVRLTQVLQPRRFTFRSDGRLLVLYLKQRAALLPENEKPLLSEPLKQLPVHATTGERADGAAPDDTEPDNCSFAVCVAAVSYMSDKVKSSRSAVVGLSPLEATSVIHCACAGGRLLLFSPSSRQFLVLQ